MAETPQYFASISASDVCKCVKKLVLGESSFPASFYSPNSTQNKRKLSFMDGSLDVQDRSSLSLGLGGSMSSDVTMFSGKETEEDSLCNFSLLIGPNGGSTRLEKTEPPKVDLELSLAAGSVESDVTRASFPFKYNIKPPVTSSTMTSPTVQLMDEGTISSRWKLPLLPSLQTEPISLFPHVQGQNGKNGLFHGVSGSFNSGSAQPQPRRTGNVKDCLFIECTRGARGASGFCIAHGGGRRCQRVGCQKGAEGRTVFCKAHGGGRRCEFLGCTKSAEGRTDFCIGHGGGRRCSHDGCSHAARGKSGLCIRHGGGKRCKTEGCTKSAEGVSGLCISHGGGRRCQFPACTKGAQGSTMFCKAHGGGKRCSLLGCTKGAEGSTSFCKGHGGGKRCTFEGGCSKSVHGGTLFCVSHGGGKRCVVPECTKSARGRTSFCVRHGGGKRCKHDGCGKSAQGRTDFCKAHGGGKRCSWGQSGNLGSQSQNSTPCDKFARGKIGLCASHSVMVQMPEPNCSGGFGLVGLAGFEARPVVGQYVLSEGRVHGGGLMAMLRGSTGLGRGSSESGETQAMAARWWV